MSTTRQNLTPMKSQTAAMQGSACSLCGGQLAALSGPVMIDDPTKPPGAKKIVEASPRGRRERYIGCGSCHTPVPLNHSRQIAVRLIANEHAVLPVCSLVIVEESYVRCAARLDAAGVREAVEG